MYNSDNVPAIEEFCRIFLEEGNVYELRAPKCFKGGTASGYFDDWSDLARAADALSGGAPSVYLTINPVDDRLLARSANEVTHWSHYTTTDNDIVWRSTLLADFDPVRPAGISSTNEEHEIALDRTRKAKDYLSGLGWPDPIIGDSGNGGHLVYRIALEATQEHTELVQRVLGALAERFSDAACTLDTSVCNAARISKVYGTSVRKGSNTPDRPWRIAQVLDAPEKLVVVQKRLLLDIAGPKIEKPTGNDYSGGKIDVEAFLSRHSLEHRPKQPYKDGYKWVLHACPFNPDHAAPDSMVFQLGNGAVGFRCLHNSCCDNHWKELRSLLEPNRNSPLVDFSELTVGVEDFLPVAPAAPDEFQVAAEQAQQKAQQKAQEEAGRAYQFKPLTSAEMDAQDYRQSWLVRRLIVQDQPCLLGGPKKVLKTNMLVDLVISLGTGGLFLGYFECVKARTAFISGESGGFTIQETARRICRAKDIRLADADVLWDFRLPRLAVAEELRALTAGLRSYQAEVVVIDPLYLCLLAGSEADAKNVFDMGGVLSGVSVACREAGCTPILVHHAKKFSDKNVQYQPIEMDDLAFSGFSEFARQWVLLNRRSRYRHDGKHELWLGAGGSVGHSGLYGVDINEGELQDDFSGRIWDVEVVDVDEARRRTKETRNINGDEPSKKPSDKDAENVTTFLRVLAALDTPPTGTAMRTKHLRWNYDKYARVHDRLVREEKVKIDQKTGAICLADQGTCK